MSEIVEKREERQKLIRRKKIRERTVDFGNLIHTTAAERSATTEIRRSLVIRGANSGLAAYTGGVRRDAQSDAESPDGICQ